LLTLAAWLWVAEFKGHDIENRYCWTGPHFADGADEHPASGRAQRSPIEVSFDAEQDVVDLTIESNIAATDEALCLARLR